MSGEVIDLASRRPGARIVIAPRDGRVAVILDPPAFTPGIRGGSFDGFAPAHRHALAIAEVTRRPIEVLAAGNGDSGAAA